MSSPTDAGRWYSWETLPPILPVVPTTAIKNIGFIWNKLQVKQEKVKQAYQRGIAHLIQTANMKLRKEVYTT